jgi:hypothetical protein
MEIAKALWQLSYAMLIFAGYLLFMIFVAPFGFGFATFVSAWSSFRGRSYLSATVAVFTAILLEVFGFEDLDRCSLVDFRKPRSIPLKAVGRPLNRGVERVFNPDRKDTHWGKPKLNGTNDRRTFTIDIGGDDSRGVGMLSLFAKDGRFDVLALAPDRGCLPDPELWSLRLAMRSC